MIHQQHQGVIDRTTIGCVPELQKSKKDRQNNKKHHHTGYNTHCMLLHKHSILLQSKYSILCTELCSLLLVITFKMPVLTDRDKVIFGHFLCAHSSARALKACIQCIKETKRTEIASLLHKNKNHSYQEQSMFVDVPLGLHGIISWYLHVALINYSPTINILIPESNCRNLAITTSLPCFYFSLSIICVFLTK